jgi:sigma-E factor negative regulatory protein RseB
MSSHPRFQVRFVLPLLAAMLAFSAAVCAQSDGELQDPAEWLNRMGQAVEQLNYQGTMVHNYRGEADASRIVHRVNDGIVTERITALEDGGREIIRSDGEVTCIFPDQKMIMIEHQEQFERESSPVMGQLPDFMTFDDDSYEVAMLGPGRATGRPCEVLSVHPRDGFRYGYRLWIDRETGMLLKSQLMDGQDKVVEEMMFTDISFPASISAEEVEPSVAIEAYTWTRPEPVRNRQIRLGDVDWEAMELPPGFVLSAVQSSQATEERGPLEHLVYSDGLASVSVFIESDIGAADKVEGLSQIGTARAYTTTHDGCLITAVGDVPERTARMIALSVRPVR